jgi:hypothetical protein
MPHCWKGSEDVYGVELLENAFELVDGAAPDLALIDISLREQKNAWRLRYWRNVSVQLTR